MDGIEIQSIIWQQFNNIANTALLYGAQLKKDVIDADIMYKAIDDIDVL